jgi:hypothetical protein
VRQSVPQDNGLDLLQAGHQELGRSAGLFGRKVKPYATASLAHHRNTFRALSETKAVGPDAGSLPAQEPDLVFAVRSLIPSVGFTFQIVLQYINKLGSQRPFINESFEIRSRQFRVSASLKNVYSGSTIDLPRYDFTIWI